MKFTELYNILTSDSFWSRQDRKIRVLAARYHLGVDSADDLHFLAKPQPCYEDYYKQPILSKQDVELILSLA